MKCVVIATDRRLEHPNTKCLDTCSLAWLLTLGKARPPLPPDFLLVAATTPHTFPSANLL